MNDSTEPSVSAAGTASPQTLLEQLGGDSALDALVGAFYFNVLVDDRVAMFFADTDIEVILNHQRMFLATVLGVENRYRGRNLRDAHRALVEKSGLDDTHFDAIVEILSFTLDQFGYPNELRQQVVSRVLALRHEVLGG
jgi:hemoglobin